MIDLKWLESIKGIIIEYHGDSYVICQLEKREIKIEFSKFVNGTSDINIYFIEEGIFLFHLEICEIDIDSSKDLFIQWLVNKIHINSFAQINQNIRTEEICNYYLKGEDAMILYYWGKVKLKLHDRSADKMVSVLNLCLESPILNSFIPYISVGRICLSKTPVKDPHSSDCKCLNFVNGKYEVANYQHENIHLFETAIEAVKYVEEVIKKTSSKML